jgi:NADPH:quinone reductase-like Zn-dependent oxidoreductase
MTRVAQPRDFGGPDQLEVVDVDTPEPGEGEVRVAVRAIGVNPVDWYHYDGVHSDDPEDLRTFGYEVSGLVDAVGPGVTGFAVGDEVVVAEIPGNGYAEHVIAPVTGLLPKPAEISFEVAASVPVAAGTAYHALEKTHVGPGDVVLAQGASGGVGTLLVQLARERGARVIATGRPEKHDYLRSLGAEPVAYGEGLVERVRVLAPEGIDVAIDLVGTEEAVDTSLELVPDRSRVLTIAAFGRAPGLGIHLIGNGPGADPGLEVRPVGRAEALRLLAEGRIDIPIERIYKLDEVADAHRASMTRRTQGKLVVVP